MAWIPLHQALPTHRKIKKLKRLLKIQTPQAVGHVVMLWLWSVDNAPDGDLSQVDAEDIAEAAEWPKDAKVFVQAMKDAEWIDDNMKLHDWDEYGGRLNDQRDEERKKERDRKAAYRAKKRMEGADNRDCHVNVPRDSPTQDGTVPPLDKNRLDKIRKENNTKPLKQEGGCYLQPPTSAPAQVCDDGLSRVISAYFDKISPAPSESSMKELTEFYRQMGAEVCLRAIDRALDAGTQAANWNYIRGTLRNLLQQGVKCLTDWDKLDAQHKQSRDRRTQLKATGFMTSGDYEYQGDDSL